MSVDREPEVRLPAATDGWKSAGNGEKAFQPVIRLNPGEAGLVVGWCSAPNPTLAGLASDPGGGVFVRNDPCRTKPPSSAIAAMDGVVRSVATIYHRV